MVEVTRREKTEEEKKVIDEVRKSGAQWMGEDKMEDVKKQEPQDGERVNLKINQIPAITFLEGNLPRTMLDELNTHVDEHRDKLEDFSQNLVAQIKQTEKSQQLSLDMKQPVVQGLVNLMSGAGRTFLKSYANQISKLLYMICYIF